MLFRSFNRLRELIRFSLTGSMDADELSKTNPFFDGYAITVTASMKPGRIAMIKGLDELRAFPEVIHLRELHVEGDTILLSNQGTLASVFAYVLCTARTKEEMRKLISKIRDTLIVIDENGNDMLNEFLDPEKITIK